MGGSSGGSTIREGRTYFGGGAGAIPQDRLAGLGLGGNTNPGSYNPNMAGGSPQHPGDALTALFLGNSRNAAPTVRLPMIQRPTQQPIPMPSAPAPTPQPVQQQPQGIWIQQGGEPVTYGPGALFGSNHPTYYVNTVTGQRMNPREYQAKFGGPKSSQWWVKDNGNTPMGGGIPANTGPGSGGAPLSQAAILARAINEQAAKKGQS